MAQPVVDNRCPSPWSFRGQNVVQRPGNRGKVVDEVLGYEYPQGQSALDLEDVEDAIGRLVDGSAPASFPYPLMLHLLLFHSNFTYKAAVGNENAAVLKLNNHRVKPAGG